MRKLVLSLWVICLGFIMEAHGYYGKQLCAYREFNCIKIKRHDAWQKLWPDPFQRDLVMRVNRFNLPLSSHSSLAVPKNLRSLSLLDLAPFPAHIDSLNQKTIIVDLTKLAFG